MSSSGQTPMTPSMTSEGMVNHYEGDYIISDYMERLGTRLNILETELKYAWRALDLLSQEYVKMWERLEKLEGLLYDQQSVISHLLDFYTSEGGDLSALVPVTNGSQVILKDHLGQLEVIREILGNGTVEDGLEEGVDVTGHNQSAMMNELQLDMRGALPDEAFYRSLNQAYREDLVSTIDPPRPPSQLGMIWEDPEETEDSNHANAKEVEKLMAEAMSEETQEVFSAMDYKYYRGNSPCVSEQDLAQLSRLNSMDQVAIDKLHELDRLTTKLQSESHNLKELESRLLESPRIITKNQSEKAAVDVDERVIAEDTSIIDEQLRQIYADSDNWSFSSGPRGIEELILLASVGVPTTIQSSRSVSRLSIADSVAGIDNEVAETLAGGFRSPRVTSPRHRIHEPVTSSEPYSTVQGRLAYSSAVLNAETNASNSKQKSPKLAKKPTYNPFLPGYDESLIAASYSTISCASPSIFTAKSEKPSSPTLSICSASSSRTRQDGYVDVSGKMKLEDDRENRFGSPSPPPPAPQDAMDAFIIPDATSNTSPFLTASDSSNNNVEHGRLSPRSPRSPKTSPKYNSKSNSNIVAAKSDSGLSSMSGWSSLEKSPGSPKSSRTPSSYMSELHARTAVNRTSSPMPASVLSTTVLPPLDINKPYLESDTDCYLTGPIKVPVCSAILPGGHHLSAFTTVKSPCGGLGTTSDGYGTFVPAPAPCSDINVSPRRRKHHNDSKEQTVQAASTSFNDYLFRGDHQPAIYSVAGSNRNPEAFKSVYTNVNTTNALSQSINYPDLIEPYNDTHNTRFPPEPSYHAQTSIPPSQSIQAHNKRGLTRGMSTTSMPGENVMSNHEGYKTAMYRTMFPTGNLTDALVYYPTNTRYDSPPGCSLPRVDRNDPNAAWLSSELISGQMPHDSTSSSLRSAETVEAGNSYIDPRYQQYRNEYQRQFTSTPPSYDGPKKPEEPYPRTWNQRAHLQYLELDLRNRNVQEQGHASDYYDASGVIVSQSGYISISTDIKSMPKEYKLKKSKRGSLKSAMSSVSHWLPDLHLTKRHRSNSLPVGVHRDDLHSNEQIRTGGSLKDRAPSTGTLPRKKKKYPLVATMSGILQKAKRRANSVQSQQSLSDPEQSEAEWSIGRSSAGVSDSEDGSLMSENAQPNNLFAKVASSKNNKKITDEDMYQQQVQKEEMQKQQTDQQQNHQQMHQQQMQQQQVQQQQMQQQQKIQQQMLQQQMQQYNVQPMQQQQFQQYQLQQQQMHQQQLQQQQLQQQQLLQQQMQQQQLQYQQSINQQPQSQVMFPQVAKSKQRDSYLDPSKAVDTETDLSDNVPGEEENSGKSTGSASSSIFATIGDVKRSNGSDESSNGDNRSFGPVNLGGASMEFAVSRALGKYRQRRSTSASDEQNVDDSGSKSDEMEPTIDIEDVDKELTPPEIKGVQSEITTKSSPESLFNKSISVEDASPPKFPDGSPSASSMRSYQSSGGRFLPRNQQSLDIPIARNDDDDNKSQHSWRSGSRVSSRRQSTEDSIDSEDEWYCYELRKLEELERQSHLETEIGETLVEVPEVDQESYEDEPDEDVKERMSFVLRELRMKVKTKDDVLEEQDYKKQVIQSAKRRTEEAKKGPKSVYSEFARVTDYQTWREADEKKEKDGVKSEGEEEDDQEHTSGDTSGPDSPQQSMDELDDEDLADVDEIERRRSSSGSTMRQSDRIPSDSRSNSTSVPPSERSSTIQHSEGWDSEETATMGDDSYSTDTTAIPLIKIDSSAVSNDSGKDGGPLGSKWKLLKALKERKAEEKNNQEKIQEAAAATTQEKDKVSMKTIMQKLYEIGVKS